MTLNFGDEATIDIKALARIRRVSTTDKPAMAAMVATLVAKELDRLSEPGFPEPKKGEAKP